MNQEISVKVAQDEDGSFVTVDLPVIHRFCPGLVLAGCDGSYKGRHIGGYELVHEPTQLFILSGEADQRVILFEYGRVMADTKIDWTQAKLPRKALCYVRFLSDLYHRGFSAPVPVVIGVAS